MISNELEHEMSTVCKVYHPDLLTVLRKILIRLDAIEEVDIQVRLIGDVGSRLEAFKIWLADEIGYFAKNEDARAVHLDALMKCRDKLKELGI